MLNVLLTVDTEVWPQDPDWRSNNLLYDIDRDIFGQTSEGEYGIRYQMKTLNRHGLKAVFFLESLFAAAVKKNPLPHIISTIQDMGHEVQLHLHSEWMQHIENAPLPMNEHIKDYSESEQCHLIKQGLENLYHSGASKINAYRAGNYGANNATLRVLYENVISYDSSYNYCYLDSSCGIETGQMLAQPVEIEDIIEIPITHFQDVPGHFRPLQLCACSFSEIKHVLNTAWEKKWKTVVLVSHGFELIERPRQFAPARASRLLINRFEKLCHYLGENQDRFNTIGFHELDDNALPAEPINDTIKSNSLRTLWRTGEQLLSRFV
ncbi:MAG TPA: hypothetical protein ENG78_06175 [Acidiferrobacteraceae bacterium]|nr:hypothetical protein [Acidiferrobacteraceae bacterium]HEX20386.1 hypothetical protein [Acidiferrobacteraceae bacterium]